MVRIGLVTDFIGTNGGGVAEVVRNLAAALAGLRGCRVVVLARDAGSESGRLRDFPAVELKTFHVIGPAKLGLSTDLTQLLLGNDLDLVHLHGLWCLSMRSVTLWSKCSGGRPYMVSPHGMLDSWALGQSRLRKLAAAFVYADACLAGAQGLHALAPAEAGAMRRYGLRNTIFTVPNGVWLPPRRAQGVGTSDSLDPRRCLLYLGRLDPKKNLPALLYAWRELLFREPGLDQDWRLRLVGWGAARHVMELTRLVREHDLGGSVEIAGPVFGSEKAAAFAQAELFVLPSLSEGLPVAVLEAWSHGLPAVLSRQCNLDVGFHRGAAFPCGPDWTSIRDTLAATIGLPHAALRAAGARARALVEEQFCWEVVAARLMEIYADLVSRASRPQGD